MIVLVAGPDDEQITRLTEVAGELFPEAAPAPLLVVPLDDPDA